MLKQGFDWHMERMGRNRPEIILNLFCHGTIERGGSLINMNVISREQILEAHQDPSRYPDLIVRVTGYSAYFKTLSPEYRQQVVDRMLAAPD